VAREQTGQSRSMGWILRRVRGFLFEVSIPAMVSTQPSVQRVPGAVFPGGKRPVCEAKRSAPSNVVVNYMLG
jgi:hypothetical protein